MRVLVIDNGGYAKFAWHLGRSGLFEHVGYFAPWQTDFVSLKDCAVGTGFEEFIREWDIYEALPRYDAFVFPYQYWKGAVSMLRAQGYPVWAAGNDEELELDRQQLLYMMEAYKMPCPQYEVVKGVDAAVRAAKDGDIIKVTGYARGDLETAKHVAEYPDWANELRDRCGPLANEMSIIVQKPLKDRIEGGFDWIVVGGVPLPIFSVGYEAKDSGYVAHVTDKMPDLLLPVAAGVQKMIHDTYTNFLSVEALDDVLIDITCRVPSPPGDSLMQVYTNFPDIVKGALEGQRVMPTPHDAYFCELIICREDPLTFSSITVPRSCESRVAIHNAFKRKDVLWCPPAPWSKLIQIGSVTGMGNSPKNAIKDAQSVAEELGFSKHVAVNAHAADDILQTIDKGKKKGIPF
jgi:hypothetical protein